MEIISLLTSEEEADEMVAVADKQLLLQPPPAPRKRNNHHSSPMPLTSPDAQQNPSPHKCLHVMQRSVQSSPTTATLSSPLNLLFSNEDEDSDDDDDEETFNYDEDAIPLSPLIDVPPLQDEDYYRRSSPKRKLDEVRGSGSGSDDSSDSGSETVNPYEAQLASATGGGGDEFDVFETPEYMRDLELTEMIHILRKDVVHGFYTTMCTEDDVERTCEVEDATHLQKKNPLPAFDRTLFVDETHTYYPWNPYMQAHEKAIGSVTKIIDNYFEEFDSDAHSTRIANDKRTFGEYKNMTKEQILWLWEFGSRCGSALHKTVEHVCNARSVLDLPVNLRTSPVLNTQEFGYVLDFLEREVVGKFDFFRTEVRLTDWPGTRARQTTFVKNIKSKSVFPNDPLMQFVVPPTKLCGSADGLMRRRGAPPKVLQIWDWKRTKKIKEYSWEKKFGTYPCDDQEDCNLQHYYIQLNIYKWMLENTTDFEVERMCIVVFHPNYDSYVIYEVPNLQRKIQRIMIGRLRENCKRLRTAEAHEDVRYRMQIENFLRTMPPDPNDIWSSVKNK